MAFLSKKNNMYFTDEILLLVALHWIENFKFCSKHEFFFTKFLGFVIKKVPKKDHIS